MAKFFPLVLGFWVVTSSPALGQEWNSPEALNLVRLATQARSHQESALLDYQAEARGWVLFLTQLGNDLNRPPDLIKADQIALQVYWKAPDLMKQVIMGRRDQRLLPTDIQYHRDHLGIVQNNFGATIRLGDGHEISNVPHPLSPVGSNFYDFALVDSVITVLPGLTVRAVHLRIRPKDPGSPAIIGSVWLDSESAQVVRFEFTFTGSSYRDATVEDITVALDHGLWDGKFWLPRRQELEIRRRTPLIDLPARGIIRAEWNIENYRFNSGLADSIFRGIQVAIRPLDDLAAYGWTEPIETALRREIGARPASLEDVRMEIGRAGVQANLSGLAPTRIGIGGISDLVHVNRVEGLALGAGGVFRPLDDFSATGWLGYGLSDRRWKWLLELEAEIPMGRLAVLAERRIRDIADVPTASGALNSIGAQEFGFDFGDYYLREAVLLKLSNAGYGRFWEVWLGRINAASVETSTESMRGVNRLNPLLGTGSSFWTVGLNFSKEWRVGIGGILAIDLRAEAASDTMDLYRRGELTVHLQAPVGGTALVVDAVGGAGSEGMPAFRSFVLGGRGTLPGEEYRGFGGRAIAWSRLGWRFPVPFPSIGMGSFVSTGNRIQVTPYVSVGHSWFDVGGQPWVPSPGARWGSGIRVELLQRLVWFDLGVSWVTKEWALSADLNPVLWPIL